jgi:hypothetical protein
MNTNAGSPEKNDADILQCKIDILRARDGVVAPKTPGPTETAETTPAKDTTPEPAKADETKPEQPPENSSAGQIPQFNLAEQILVEQRKVASLRRKKPNGKAAPDKLSPVTATMARVINESKAQARPAEQIAVCQSPAVYSLVVGSDNLSRQQQQIVTNIVSADIAALCKIKPSESKARQSFSNN